MKKHISQFDDGALPLLVSECDDCGMLNGTRPGDPTVILAGSPPDGDSDDESEYEYEYYYDDDDEYYYDDEDYEDEEGDINGNSITSARPQSPLSTTRRPPRTSTASAIVPRGRGGLSNRWVEIPANLETNHYDVQGDLSG